MKPQKNILILLNGSADSETWLFNIAKNAFIIAVDGGIKHTQMLNINPDIWLGDFDSTDRDLAKKYEKIPRKVFPTDKNQSDGELALEHAIAQNPEKIALCGALGGERTDHAFFNALLAVRYAKKYPSIEFTLTGKGQIGFPLSNETPLIISNNIGQTLSVIPISNLAGLSISGVKWPLKNVDVLMGSTHTLSNIIETEATLNLSNGHAIAIVQRNM